MTEFSNCAALSAVAETDNKAGIGHAVVAVAGRDMGNAEVPDRLDAGGCITAIKLIESLVEKQNLWPAVQRAGEQESLPLSSRQGIAEIAYPAEISHRQATDGLVYGCQFCAVCDPFVVGAGVQRADVVGDGAIQQRVILHDRAGESAESAAGVTQFVAIQHDSAPGRFDQPE